MKNILLLGDNEQICLCGCVCDQTLGYNLTKFCTQYLGAKSLVEFVSGKHRLENTQNGGHLKQFKNDVA